MPESSKLSVFKPATKELEDLADFMKWKYIMKTQFEIHDETAEVFSREVIITTTEDKSVCIVTKSDTGAVITQQSRRKKILKTEKLMKNLVM